MKQTNTLTLYIKQQDTFDEPMAKREIGKPLFTNCELLEKEIQLEMSQKKNLKNRDSFVSVVESTLTNHHLLKNVHHLIF